jgi:hypothetical protein
VKEAQRPEAGNAGDASPGAKVGGGEQAHNDGFHSPSRKGSAKVGRRKEECLGHLKVSDLQDHALQSMVYIYTCIYIYI